MPDAKSPPITARTVPPVAGIDLVQSLNYTDSRGLPLEWFYTSFTYPRVFYRQGSRPRLEAFIAGVVSAPKDDLPTVEAVLDAMSRKLPHFVQLGCSGPSDRAWTEEELLESGGGWCNEQARVFLALTQVLGLPSRLVFVSTHEGWGHVISEIFLDGRWVLVDQTADFVFRTSAGRLANALDLNGDPVLYAEVSANYRRAFLERFRARSRDLAFWDKSVPAPLVENPLRYLERVGYCNYFLT